MIEYRAAHGRLKGFGCVLPVCLLLTTSLTQAQTARAPEASRIDFSDLPLERKEGLVLSFAVRAHDYTRAESMLLSAARGHADDPRFYKYLGRVFFVDHRYVDAMIALKKADAFKPLEERDRFTLAMTYISSGRPDWAQPELDRLVRDYPKEPLYVYWQGRLQYDHQDLQAAAAAFRRAIFIDAKFMRAYDNLGLCLEGLGEDEEAIKQYQQAILLNRRQEMRSVWPLLDQGALLIKLGRLEEARVVLEEALHADPKFAPVHLQMGFLLEKQHKQALAIEELDRAIAFSPGDAQAHYVLARLLRHSGNTEGARQQLTEYQRLQARSVVPQAEASRMAGAQRTE